jgi:hypothetical protein
MKKAYIFSIVLVGLFCLAPLVFGAGLQDPLGGKDFSALLGGIATAVGALIAAVGGVMVIIAGVFYLTSAGSPERIGVAKKTLIYAIIGIVVGLSANAIVDFITGITK